MASCPSIRLRETCPDFNWKTPPSIPPSFLHSVPFQSKPESPKDFIHRNDFSDSALQTFRLGPKERIKSYALAALQFRSIVLPAVPSVIGIELIRIAMQTPIDELSKFYLHIFHLQTVGGKIADIAVVKTDEQSSQYVFADHYLVQRSLYIG